MTKSSVNFKMVKSAWQAVSHASREVAPSYLLDSKDSMGTIVLLDDEGKVASTLEAKLALASRQARQEKGFSPVWEGILNLPRPEPGFDPNEYKKTCTDIVSNWCKSYETSTGHKVLRADIHLDEGHMVDGEVVLNAHAHVIADRTNDKGRVMQLSPKMLRDLQTLTAEVTGLERGESSRKTGRKHISHQAYKYLAEQGRLETQQQVGEVKSQLGKSQNELTRLQKISKEWSDSDLAKVKDLKSELAQLKAEYAAERAQLKASGEAKQADYQALKLAHEAALAKLKDQDLVIGNLLKNEAVLHGKATQMTQENQDLRTENERHEAISRITLKTLSTDFEVDIRPAAKLQGTALREWTEAAEDRVMAQLLAEREADKARFSAMAVAYQEHKTAGKEPALFVPAPAQSIKPAVLTPDPIPREATRTASEPSKRPEAPTPSPTQEKSLVEALRASLAAMLDWIKGAGGIQEPVGQSTLHFGPVKHIDELHAVQKTGARSYAVHELASLNKLPALDDPKMEIQYRDGVGQVKGQGLGKGGRAD